MLYCQHIYNISLPINFADKYGWIYFIKAFKQQKYMVKQNVFNDNIAKID